MEVTSQAKCQYNDFLSRWPSFQTFIRVHPLQTQKKKRSKKPLTTHTTNVFTQNISTDELPLTEESWDTINVFGGSKYTYTIKVNCRSPNSGIWLLVKLWWLSVIRLINRWRSELDLCCWRGFFSLTHCPVKLWRQKSKAAGSQSPLNLRGCEYSKFKLSA